MCTVSCEPMNAVRYLRRLRRLMKVSIFPILSSRQLPVSVAVHVAEVLEHEPVAGAQPAVPRARPAQVVAPGDHGRGHLLRAEGGTQPVAGRAQVRHPVPDLRAVRQPRAQHAGPQRRRRSRYDRLRPRQGMRMRSKNTFKIPPNAENAICKFALSNN